MQIKLNIYYTYQNFKNKYKKKPNGMSKINTYKHMWIYINFFIFCIQKEKNYVFHINIFADININKKLNNKKKYYIQTYVGIISFMY